jgi:hypothetical protein
LDVRMQPLHCALEQLETQYQMHLFLVGNLWQIERIMSISSMFCMRTNLVTEPDTAWQGIRSCIENYASRPFTGTFGTHYSEPISLFRLKVTLSGWPPFSVIITDCLTATDITSLKTCLAYYRLVPLVGAVGHVS